MKAHPEVVYAIGMGCTSYASFHALDALLQMLLGDVEQHFGICINDAKLASAITLATLDEKKTQCAPVAMANRMPLMLFSRSNLRFIQHLQTHSALAHTVMGIGSVAEAAALAAVGTDARLEIPRRVGHLCTAAFASRRSS